SSSTASVSFAMARLHHDGSVSIMSATSDMGQGARTVFTRLAAQDLGVAPDRVTIVMGDTAVVPFDSSTSASRSTVFMGNAILKACADIRKKLRALAAEAFHLDEAEVEVRDGVVRAAGRDLTFAELLEA